MVVYDQDVALERKLMDIEHDEVLGNDNLDGENGVFSIVYQTRTIKISSIKRAPHSTFENP